MWKLLRNSILAAALVAGLLKVVLWYEIQQGAARLSAQLAPLAQFQYGSVSAAFSGAVVFDAVNLTFGKGASLQTWRASSVELTTPGALWLARRLLLGDDSMPERLGMTVRGLQVPPAAFEPAAAWLSPLSLVPFETLGCGVVSRFSVADYQRMGLNPGAQQQRLEYRYDAASGTLDVNAELRAPPFSTITLRSELPKFDAAALASGNWSRLRIGELGVGYVDAGYFAKRNHFCAQQGGISAAQFIDQHVAGVKAFLEARGVQPGVEIETIYRSLISEGGRASVLSLPTAAPTVAQLRAESPDAMMRRLNLTARRNDTPPVLVRLAFKAVPEASAVVAATEPAPDATPAPATRAAATAPPAPVTATPTLPTGSGAAPTVATTAAKPAASAAPTATGAPAPPKPATSPTIVATPPAPHAASSKPAMQPSVAAAAAPPAKAPAANTAPAATPTHAPSSSPAASTAAKPADPNLPAPSTPAPPPDSTLALVWKPTVERLEKAPPPPRDYDVLDYASLSSYAGRYVRLLTTAGKKVEGRIIAVDPTAVGLRIQKAGGTAELQVPRTIIFEIQLPRARTATQSGNDG
jgi:hypothetical protein